MKAGESVKKTAIDGLLVIERPAFADERGFFKEIARQSDLGFDFSPVQFNHSCSLPRVIRAIHTEQMNKLIYPLTGKMFAAFVDVRVNSSTFKKVLEMEFDNCRQPCNKAVFIPPGVGNSICAVKEVVHYIYAVDKYWEPGIAQGIAWNDPDLNINWPITNPIISQRDKENPTLKEYLKEIK